MTTATERRAHERRPVSQEVMLSQGLHFRLCQLRELSLNGAFVEIGWAALTRSAPVELTITLPDAPSSKVLSVAAEVARVTDHGTALRFPRLDEATAHALGRLLQQAPN